MPQYDFIIGVRCFVFCVVVLWLCLKHWYWCYYLFSFLFVIIRYGIFNIIRVNSCLHEHINLLGTKIDWEGNSYSSMHHRLRQAEKLFWKHEGVLGKKGNFEAKLEAWNQAVVPAALFDSGGWALSVTMLRTLRKWENKYLRKMHTGAFRWATSRAEYMRRTTRALDNIRGRLGSPHIIHRIIRTYLKDIYRAGKLRDQTGRKTLQRIRRHRNKMWWEGVKDKPAWNRKTGGVHEGEGWNDVRS